MRRICVLILCVLILPFVYGEGDDEGDDEGDEARADKGDADTTREGDAQTESQHQRWRQILRYGIESEIQETLAILNRDRISEFAVEVRPLFDGNFSDALRVAMVRYFSRIEDYTVTPQVVALLQDIRNHTETLSLAGLFYLRNAPPQSLSPDTVDLVRALVKAKSPAVGRAAIDVIAAHGDASDVVLIQDVIADPSSADDVRGGAIAAIGELMITDAISNVHQILEDEQEPSYLRQYAATAIGALSQPDSVDILIQLSLHKDSRLRAAIIAALSAYDTERVTDILRDALRDTNDQVRLAAVRAFQSRAIDLATLSALQYKAVRDPYGEVQIESIVTLVKEARGRGARYVRQTIGDRTVTIAIRSEMIAQLVVHDYPASRQDVAALIRLEVGRAVRTNLFLQVVARRLSIVDAPHAGELYALLLDSTDTDTVLYAMQGINLNNITGLMERIQELSLGHENVVVRRRALLILERWAAQ